MNSRATREIRAAFSGVAATYGSSESNLTATLLRARVQRRLLERVPAGGLIVDLACGTGVDAAVFAAAGRRVLAIDLAPGMVRVARERLAPWIRRSRVRVRQGSFQHLSRRAAGAPDAVWCHWGANFEPSLSPLAACCRRILRPGGVAVFTTAMRWPAWEITMGLMRGRPREAFRRLTPRGVRLTFGGRPVTAHAPSLRRVLAPFHPGFRVEHIEPLGLLIPPPALWRRSWNRLAPVWRALNRLEPACRPLVRLADHALVIVARR